MDLSIVHIGPGSLGGEASPCPIGRDGTPKFLGPTSSANRGTISGPLQGTVLGQARVQCVLEVLFRAALGAPAVVGGIGLARTFRTSGSSASCTRPDARLKSHPHLALQLDLSR